MNNPSIFLFAGLATLACGILMIVFADPIGKGFCRFGKWIFKGDAFVSTQFIEYIYDESSAPSQFRLFGIFNIVVGILVTTAYLAIANFG